MPEGLSEYRRKFEFRKDFFRSFEDSGGFSSSRRARAEKTFSSFKTEGVEGLGAAVEKLQQIVSGTINRLLFNEPFGAQGEGAMVWLHGTTGTGKSHLLDAIGLALSKPQNTKGIFVEGKTLHRVSSETSRRLIPLDESGPEDVSFSELVCAFPYQHFTEWMLYRDDRSLLDPYCAYRVYLVDDLGRMGSETDQVVYWDGFAHFLELLRKRSALAVVTSNINPSQIGPFYSNVMEGDRVQSRLNGLTHGDHLVFEFTHDDHRGTNIPDGFLI